MTWASASWAIRPVLYGTAPPPKSRSGTKSDRRRSGVPAGLKALPSPSARECSPACISVAPMLTVLLAVAIGLVVAQVALYLTTIYLHRALSHRAITLSPVTTSVCRVLTWVLTGIRPRQWVAVHRKHHAFTDRPGDPHSPVLLGYATVQWTNVMLYRKVAR